MDRYLESSKLDLPPERLPSDSIQLLFLLTVFIIGVPTNILTLRRLLMLCKTSRKGSSRAAFLLLKLHLTLSDLMLLFFFVLPQLTWNLTYQWRLGDVLCRQVFTRKEIFYGRFYNYVSMASFYLSSNITVCIAIDRLRTVFGALQIRKGTRKRRSVQQLILSAWIIALFFASPQLVVFRTANILKRPNQTWIQCSDIWNINRHIERLNHDNKDLPEWLLTPTVKLAYEIAHLLLVFWVPLLLLFTIYGTIALRLSEMTSLLPQSRCSSNQSFVVEQLTRANSVPKANEASEGGLRVMLIKSISLSPAKMRTALSRISLSSRSSEKGDATPQGGTLWRKKIREKLFRSTLLIVIAHFLFWLPYNLSALLTHISQEYKEMIALHAYFLNDLQVVITLVNPLLYAITE